MKYPFRGTHSGLTSPPSDIDLLTGSPVGRIATMAEVVDGSAVIPAGPASPPPTPPELPTAAGKDVPRSVPHPVTEYGNHYIYLRDPSVSRHLQSSNVEGKGGEDSAGADQNSNDARFCLSTNGWTEEEMGYDNGQLPGTASLPPRLVMNGKRFGERGGAGRTPPAAPAPELRSHGEGPERFFPSRTASSSPHSFQDSNGATISGNTGSHRQDGVPFVPVTRATKNTSTSTCFTDSDRFTPPLRRTAGRFPNYGGGNNRDGSFNNAATTPEAQTSMTMHARSEGQQAEPSTPTAHQMSTTGAAFSSSPRAFPAGLSRAQATTAFGNLRLGRSPLGAEIGPPTSVHSGARSFASSDDRNFGIAPSGQPSPTPITTSSGFAAASSTHPTTQPPRDHEAFYREQAFHHHLAAGNPTAMEWHRFRDPSIRNPHVRGPNHDAAAEQALLAQYLADGQGQEHAQSADQQHAMMLYALSERNPLVDQAAQDEAAWAGAVPAPDDRPPFHMYALHRSVGVYTPLVPADMLPPLLGVPKRLESVAGMWVVPPPRVPAPDGHWVYNRRIGVRGNVGQDNASPSSQHQQYSPASATQNPYEGHAGLVYPPEDLQFAADHFRPLGWSPPHQARIDGIVAARSANQARPGTIPAMPATTTTSPTTPVVPRSAGLPQRRVKIYCDKWVHEGICAFTQQGCKYKHEMPQDKATQHSLGLFHGLPAWWKKQQGELARSSVVPVSGNHASPPPTPGLRRFGVGGGGNGVTSVAGRFGQRSVTTCGGGPGPATAASWRAGARGVGGGLFGPIGPPQAQVQMQSTMTTTAMTTTQGMGQQQKGSSAEELRLSMFPVGRVDERKEEEKGEKEEEKQDKDGEDGKDEKGEE